MMSDDRRALRENLEAALMKLDENESIFEAEMEADTKFAAAQAKSLQEFAAGMKQAQLQIRDSLRDLEEG